MAEHRTIATREKRRGLLGVRRKREVPDDVDAAITAVKETVSNEPLDDGRTYASRKELRSLDGALLI